MPIAPRHRPYLEADKAEILELLKSDQRPQGLNVGQIWHKLHIPRDRIRNAINSLLEQEPCPIVKIKPAGQMIKDFRNANSCAARFAIRKDTE